MSASGHIPAKSRYDLTYPCYPNLERGIGAIRSDLLSEALGTQGHVWVQIQGAPVPLGASSNPRAKVETRRRTLER